MRLIDAEALWCRLMQEAIEEQENDNAKIVEGIDKAIHCIDVAPTIEAKPVVHAHWEEVQCSKNSAKWLHRVSCSNCHNEGHKRYDYCPHCGAQMDEEVSE